VRKKGTTSTVKRVDVVAMVAMALKIIAVSHRLPVKRYKEHSNVHICSHIIINL
jgi:hypothetical protein